MIDKSAASLAKYCNGKWNLCPSEQLIKGINQDTRKLKNGEIYIALEGQSDGHMYVEDAFKSGALGAIVRSDYIGKHKHLLYVNSPLKALQDIGKNNRSAWDGCLIAITGSVGKTTVKELCSVILQNSYSVHKTFSNYNNHIGVPLTLSSLEKQHEFSLVELGMSNPGEIIQLANWVNPNIAIITDIGLAHRANFKSIESIANEKASLLTTLSADGTAILDIDSPWYSLFCTTVNANILTVSMKGLGDINGYYQSDNSILIDGFQYTLPQPGEHMGRNVLRAVALGKLLGIEANDIQKGLSLYCPPTMRWQEHNIDNIKWINDAYNANPLSMRAALKTFNSVVAKKKWVVVGKMEELGEVEEEEHQLLFKYLDSLPLDGWIAIGLSEDIYRSNSHGIIVKDIEDAVTILKNKIHSGDSILLKASRGERLEKILDFFKKD